MWTGERKVCVEMECIKRRERRDDANVLLTNHNQEEGGKSSVRSKHTNTKCQSSTLSLLSYPNWGRKSHSFCTPFHLHHPKKEETKTSLTSQPFHVQSLFMFIPFPRVRFSSYPLWSPIYINIYIRRTSPAHDQTRVLETPVLLQLRIRRRGKSITLTLSFHMKRERERETRNGQTQNERHVKVTTRWAMGYYIAKKGEKIKSQKRGEWE